MKKNDVIFICCLAAAIAPFLLIDSVMPLYVEALHSHKIAMSFLQFALLATLGESIALRITQGVYNRPGFGLLPRALVWGCLGVVIKMAFTIFAVGTPEFVGHYVYALPENVMAGPFSASKLIAAFSISVTMNLLFAPVFMTFHKITDIHILKTGGTLKGLFQPIDFARILKELDWSVMWGFVFKKTLPLFWIPAHTITFLLQPSYQILFAAMLGIVLGVLLGVAGRTTVQKPVAACT
ncbi:MAG: hypothetical protein EG828_08485 [Deltaproteobacteria bacterium]|nr:hypothetical protein [Deltaproteobacteria bacterium]